VSNGRLDRQNVEKPDKIPQPPEHNTPNTFAKPPRTLSVQNSDSANVYISKLKCQLDHRKEHFNSFNYMNIISGTNT